VAVLSAPAIEGPEAGRELLVGEGLDEVVIRARVQSFDAIGNSVARGQHQDRGAVAGRAKTACHLEPADVWQADIQHQGVEPRRLGDVERRFPVRGVLDQVSITLEQPLQQAPETEIVFDDEEMHDPILRRLSGKEMRPMRAGRGAPRRRYGGDIATRRGEHSEGEPQWPVKRRASISCAPPVTTTRSGARS
jgi:hypothetical protein